METILLVEDDAPSFEVMRHVLGGLGGYTVLEAHDAQEAIRIGDQHRQYPIHLLLCDMTLRDGTGKEVGQRLKASRPRMEVLYTSGWPREYLAAQGLLARGDWFLEKPFTAGVLLAAVRSVLSMARAA